MVSRGELRDVLNKHIDGDASDVIREIADELGIDVEPREVTLAGYIYHTGISGIGMTHDEVGHGRIDLPSYMNQVFGDKDGTWGGTRVQVTFKEIM